MRWLGGLWLRRSAGVSAEACVRSTTAGDAFIGGVDQAIAGVDSVVDEAFDSGFIDLLGR